MGNPYREGAYMTMNPKPIFDAVRTLHGPLSQRDVDFINAAIAAAQAGEELPPASSGRDVTPEGLAAMRQHEGCRLNAYPDPGSRDGNPWTIGYGATGPGIARGTVWTQQQADDRFTADIRRFEDQVEKLLGNARTSPAQFDSLVSLAFNIGVGAFGKSTLLKKHLAGDFEGAAREFGKWIMNDGKPMDGLRKRRAAEAAHYRGQA